MPKIGTSRQDSRPTTDVPPTLRPFMFHGVGLEWRDRAKEAVGECPFCSAEGKFYTSLETGLWSCKVCSAQGNPTTFLRQLYDASGTHGLDSLVAERGLLSADSLAELGLRRSIASGDWIIPGYAADGERELRQLYRYVLVRGDDGKLRRVFRPTPGIDHFLTGVPAFDVKKPDVYLCEGVWDAAALLEMLGRLKEVGEGTPADPFRYSLTGSPASSMLARSNVLASPSCSTFHESWSPLFAGKRVFLAFDSDHPKEMAPPGMPARWSPSAGWAGMKRVARLLKTSPHPPEGIFYLKWGENGYDPDKKSGWDVRDELTAAGKSASERVGAASGLFGKFTESPAEWFEGVTSRGGGSEVEPLECSSWATLVNAWKKALAWSAELEKMLSVMLAVVLSTDTVGQQIWVLVLAPPSSGKTTLSEGLGVARRYVHQKSELKNLYSGYKADKEGTEDFSLVPQLKGKTLVVKDIDPLLRSPNRAQILSQLRDLYDGTSRSHFNNGAGRDYEGHRMTAILCGTGASRELDAAEYGARFLVCDAMSSVDEQFERSISRRVAYRAFRNVQVVADGTPETRTDPALLLAQRMTGGYVEYLRQNVGLLTASVEVRGDLVERVIDLGEFAAFMRARPPQKHEESTEREMPFRLVEQITRLTTCLAAVVQRPKVDEKVLATVSAVALDTSRGRTLEIAKHLYDAGTDGLDPRLLQLRMGGNSDRMGSLLTFLRRVGVAEFVPVEGRRIAGPRRLRLTARLTRLYREVVHHGDEP